MPGDSVSQGSGSGAGLLSDALLGFAAASLSRPEKWAKNGTCQGFPTGTTALVLAQAWAGQRRGSSLLLAGLALWKGQVGPHTGPGAAGERAGFGMHGQLREEGRGS